ncbi:MAG: chemotaxis protein CheX [Spirochaetales bacterium]|nr:chemotaxis protein CheX [Spirochaetales bacterium]
MEKMNEIDGLFSEIVGETGFVFADPVDLEVVDVPEDLMLVFSTVKYEGDANGLMTFLIDKRLATEFVKNMLGLEEEVVTSEIIRDGIEEFSNIFCGHFVKALYGNKVNYSIKKFDFGLVKSNFLLKSDGRVMRLFMSDDNFLALCFKEN